MLRSVVGALAANMMLVQCNSDVPISLACSGSQLRLLNAQIRILRTRTLTKWMMLSPGEQRRPSLREAPHRARQSSFELYCHFGEY